MASIREVARVAGVSPSTVSEVLNNSSRARIGADAQERVRRVAIELDYRPNSLARSLSSGRTQTVGLLVSGLRNPFFVALAESIEEAVREHGFAPVNVQRQLMCAGRVPTSIARDKALSDSRSSQE